VGAWEYATHIASAAGSGSGNMYGWNGLLASTFAPGDPGSMTFYSVPLALGTLACAALLWRGPFEPRSALFPAQWLALSLATVLWDAHFYMQDLVILALPAVAVLASATGWRQAMTAAALVLGWMIVGLGSTPSQSWGINLAAIYMALCLTTMVAWHIASGVGLGTARRFSTWPSAGPEDSHAQAA
jgi:hypothetical protein